MFPLQPQRLNFLKILGFVRVAITSQQKGNNMSELRKPWVYEDVEKILIGFKDGLPDAEIADLVGRTEIRIDLVRQFYRSWVKKGKIWSGNGVIADLFTRYHEENNLPQPPEYYSEPFRKSLETSETSELLKSPYVEFEVVIKKFTQDVTRLAKEIARQEVNEELKKFVGKVQQRLDSPKRRNV